MGTITVCRLHNDRSHAWECRSGRSASRRTQEKHAGKSVREQLLQPQRIPHRRTAGGIVEQAPGRCALLPGSA